MPHTEGQAHVEPQKAERSKEKGTYNKTISQKKGM